MSTLEIVLLIVGGLLGSILIGIGLMLSAMFVWARSSRVWHADQADRR